MWKKKRNHRAAGGFSLLEIVVAMALISIALLAVSRLQSRNMDLQWEARFLTTARYLAQDRIARIEALAQPEPGTASGAFGEDFPGYGYREEITAVEGTDRLYRVTVSVTLSENAGERAFSTTTYLYRGKG